MGIYMASPNTYDNMHCSNEVDYPIEHLFKAVQLMQDMGELDKETERLRKKLHKFLMKATKEEKGKRQYENAIEYYPNGLCSWGRWDIILEGYASDYIPPEPEPIIEVGSVEEIESPVPAKPKVRKGIRKYPVEQVLREEYPIWYAQIKEHLKRKNYKFQYFAFQETAMKANIYKQLDKQERKMIDESHGLGNQIQSLARKIFTTFIGHNDQRFPYYQNNMEEEYKFYFLLEEEIEELLAICERGRNLYHERKANSNWYYGSILEETKPFIDEFIKNLRLNEKKEGRVLLDLSAVPSHEIEEYEAYESVPDPARPNASHCYIRQRVQKTRYTTNALNIFTELPKQLAKIEDETIIKILTGMGLYVPELFPEPEEEPEAEVTTTIIDAEPEIIILEVGEKTSLKEKVIRSKHTVVIEA